MKGWRDWAPGLVLVTALAGVAEAGCWLWSMWGGGGLLSPLLAGVVLGMVVANTVELPGVFAPGVRFAAQKVLRGGIVLMGLRLTLGQLAGVGLPALVVVLVGSGLTFGFTLVLGRWLRLPPQRTILVASGTTVCGAAAIAAVDGSLKAPAEDVGFALASVTLFGTLAVFVYPEVLVAFHLAPAGYALWTGASVHEVAQVAAAASVLDPVGQALASTVKMVRVLLILPLTLGLSVFPGFFGLATGAPGTKKVSVPWFALGFFGVSVVFSWPLLPPRVTEGLLTLDGGLLTAAMVALGLGIRFSRFRGLSGRSLWLAFLPTVFLSAVTAATIGLLGRW